MSSKLSVKQLKEIISNHVKESLLKANTEEQLEDIVSIMELITDKVMNFPVDDKDAIRQLPRIVASLQKIDYVLGKLRKE